MNNNYFRVSYKGVGIYQAIKDEIWNNGKISVDTWMELKKMDEFTWLKQPNIYNSNCYSYFTELGYNLFMKNTYPIIIKYLDKKNILTEKVSFNNKIINLVYEDEHQIVIEM